MSSVLLVNPAKRGARKRKSKWYPVAAHKRNPIKRRRKAAKRKARKAVAIFSNPAPMARRKRRSGVRIMRAMNRRRRNPINVGMSLSSVKGQLVTAATGAVGAVVVDTAFQVIPLPAMLKTGVGRHASKAALAILLGTVGKKVLPKHAPAAAMGALTMVLYAAGKELLAKAAPAQVGEYLSEYLSGEELAEVEAEMSGLSAYNAALPVMESPGMFAGGGSRIPFNTANV